MSDFKLKENKRFTIFKSIDPQATEIKSRESTICSNLDLSSGLQTILWATISQ